MLRARGAARLAADLLCVRWETDSVPMFVSWRMERKSMQRICAHHNWRVSKETNVARTICLVCTVASIDRVHATSASIALDSWCPRLFRNLNSGQDASLGCSHSFAESASRGQRVVTGLLLLCGSPSLRCRVALARCRHCWLPRELVSPSATRSSMMQRLSISESDPSCHSNTHKLA